MKKRTLYLLAISLLLISVPEHGRAQTPAAHDPMVAPRASAEAHHSTESLVPPPSGLLALSFPRSVYETLKSAQRLLTDRGVITKDLHWWVDLTGPWEEFQWVIGVTLVYAPDSYFRVYYDKRDVCIRFVAFYKL